MSYKLSELEYSGIIDKLDPVVLYVVQSLNDRKLPVDQIFDYVISRLYNDDEFFDEINKYIKNKLKWN